MLRLTLFGGFALAGRDGAAVLIASRKCRALLAFLALQRRPVAREQAASLLWADGGEARARASLRQALLILRREVPGDGQWLEATPETVTIDHGKLWVDAIDAEALLAAEPERALALCGRGPLLAGLTVDAEEFEEWRVAEQRRWREREAAALQALAERARRAGQEEQLLDVGRRLLKLEPWNEEAHRAVMQALAALGRYSEALRQYHVAAETLRTALRVAPSPETERLLVHIRAQRKGPADAPSDGAGPVGRAGVPVQAGADQPAATEADAPPSGGEATGTPEGRSDAPVGRDLEGRQIEGLLQGCRASGRGHVIVVRGVAGIGKTTFLRQALERSRAAGFAAHMVQVGALGGGRNVEVVRGVLAALEAERHVSATHRLALDELLGNPLDTQQTAVADALDPEARAEAHARAAEALVAAAGAQQARVIAVEDLHWCDAETTRILCAVAGAAPQHGTVVMFTCRSGEEPSDLAWADLVRRGSLTFIDLGPLGPEDAALLAARYDWRGPEVTRRCIERAAGHPLFLVQLLESGEANASVPQSVQAAVLARFGRVGPADRRVLEAAAVLATPFTRDQMAWLLEGDWPAPTALVAQGWLLSAGSRLAIAHDLVAAAIRSALDGPVLARLHRRAAEWFLSRDSLTSAEHLQRAGDPGAAGAYLSVAREALRERRLDRAEMVLERLDGCPSQPAVAFEALCLRGDVRREQGDAAGSHAVFARAVGQARCDEQTVRARLGMAAAMRLLDRHDEALACLDEATPLTAADDHTTRAALEHLRGNLLFTTGDLPGCRGAHERALAHARQADSALDEAAALNGLGDASYLAGRVTSASRAFKACRELASAHGFLRIEAASCAMLGMTGLYTNELAGAMDSVERALDLATQIADLRLQCLAGVVAAFVLRERSDWAAMRVHGERAHAAARRLGSERFEAMALEKLAQALLGEGRQPEALSLARQALSLCQRSGGLPVYGPSIMATLALAEPDREAAETMLGQAEALLEQGGPCHSHFDLREAGITLALRHGAAPEAGRHADLLERALNGEPTARSALIIEGARLLAALAARPEASEPSERLSQLCARAESAGLVLLARSFAGHRTALAASSSAG